MTTSGSNLSEETTIADRVVRMSMRLGDPREGTDAEDYENRH